MTLLEKIKMLRELEKKATPGPWYRLCQPFIHSSMSGLIIQDNHDPHGAKTICRFDINDVIEDPVDIDWENAKLVSVTRNALPELLDALVEAVDTLQLIADGTFAAGINTKNELQVIHSKAELAQHMSEVFLKKHGLGGSGA